ncbi:MAG TPA: alpha-glucan family phosphorylase [Thermoanaerobaculia bacterium]|nr:alpha-glucan family phosphorylase [Thermoanaerobaculia bacterium]
METPLRKHPPLPAVPEAIAALADLAFDLRASWRPEVARLFAGLDGALWTATRQNAVALLQRVPAQVLDAAASDPGYVAAVAAVRRALEEADERPSPLAGACELEERGERIAYFCAEFGVAECLPIYAGGLGILAGDTLKSASDLRVPLVGVGLFYREGYFRQALSDEGRQEERNPPADPDALPLALAIGPDGMPLEIFVDFPGRRVGLAVRLARVGATPLVLLDSDLEGNSPADRAITHRLYGGDAENRLQQEILLGIGGMRALDALGWRPAVRHLNEGHAAFATLERIRQLVREEGLPFAEARRAGAAGNVFTTHTPVPAGIDLFPHDLIEPYFADLAAEIGLSTGDFYALGAEIVDPERNLFSMAALALRLSAKTNAVSKLHARVARGLWQKMTPETPVDEVPIFPITNGVHRDTWTDPDMRFEDPKRADPPEIWRRHQGLRRRLVVRCREILGSDVLDPEALTIGFARRFATYKRAPLVFTDPDRLARLIHAEGRPLQFVFSGKAHPHDQPGKEFVHRIVGFSREDRFRGRVVFLPDYDVDIARLLVSGCDVWLNNPERPLEASGTSGMKAGMNGVLNLSALDGWWDEAPREETGFTFGLAQDHPPADLMAQALYTVLENEVIPLFWERNGDGVPRGWVEKMRGSMDRIGALFSTDRMIGEYLDVAWIGAARRSQRGEAGARAAAAARPRRDSELAGKE